MSVFLRNIIVLIIVVTLESSVQFRTAALEEEENADLLVRISEGVIRGMTMRTAVNNITYRAFLGIPYGKPPVGDLRFKDPEPVGPWDGIYNATKEGNQCAQFSGISMPPKVTGSEDCLFINVYTPQVKNALGASYPVMVWIHGGAFLMGSGNRNIYGPDLLIEHEVIIITLNYRLGPLGFLSLKNDDAPGNAGLKDQVLALQWVKSNIHNFGGDQGNITIFGESAGSACVHYHTISPMSKGLFHRAIMESGFALNQWAYTEIPVERAFELGETLGYKGDNKKELYMFLRNSSAYELTAGQKFSYQKNFPPCFYPSVWKVYPPFVPTAEKSGPGKHFLTDHPRNLVKRGEFTRVPSVIGLNTNEAIFLLSIKFLNTKDYGHDYGEFIPDEFCYKNGTDEFLTLKNHINDFYFQNCSFDLDHIPQIVNALTDFAFTIGVHETINYLLNDSKYNSDLYVYHFAFEGKDNLLKRLVKMFRSDLKLPPGPSHADEIAYIFHQNIIKRKYDLQSREMKVINHMTSMWTNFAKSSSPNGENVEIVWEPTTKEHMSHLNIDENLTMFDTIIFPEQYKFWSNLYKKYYRSELPAFL